MHIPASCFKLWRDRHSLASPKLLWHAPLSLRYQHARDYSAGASGPAAKKPRVSEATVRSAALESALPAYALPARLAQQAQHAERGQHQGRGGARARPFRSLLLSPAARAAPEAPWHVIPGGLPAPAEGAGGAAAAAAGPPAPGGSQEDGSARYFSAPASDRRGGAGAERRPAASPGAAGGGGGGQWQQRYEERLSESPGDEELWVEYALQHLPPGR